MYIIDIIIYIYMYVYIGQQHIKYFELSGWTQEIWNHWLQALKRIPSSALRISWCCHATCGPLKDLYGLLLGPSKAIPHFYAHGSYMMTYA